MSRIAARRPLRASGGGGGGGGGGPQGWLVPALLVLVLLLGGSAAWRWWGPGAHSARPVARKNAPTAPLGPRPKAPVRIEVLNGSGEPGAAGKLASYLRAGGFNVVLVGSADRYDYLRTLVVARTEDDRPAREVTRYLGDVSRVTQRARSEADVTVVVGKDRGRSPWGEGKDPNDRG
jgi:hypothetical protein